MADPVAYVLDPKYPGLHFFVVDRRNWGNKFLNESPEPLISWGSRTSVIGPCDVLVPRWEWFISPLVSEWLKQNGYHDDAIRAFPVEKGVALEIADETLAFAFRIRFC